MSGRKAVILLTDRIDTASTRTTLEKSADLVATGNMEVFPIQYEPESTLRQRLDPKHQHSPVMITTPSGEAAFEQIAAELRQHYYLGFYPESSPTKVERRKLKVTGNLQDIRVEARDTYIARPCENSDWKLKTRGLEKRS